ncbi:MAG: hypothetical protein ACYTG7_23110 [Planctomycetota bacterium]
MDNTRTIRLTEKEYNFLRYVIKAYGPTGGVVGTTVRRMVEKLEKSWAEAGDFRKEK